MNDVSQESYQLPGITVNPSHGGQLTIPKGLRIYTGSSCGKCDPVTYVFEGRASAQDLWVEIASGQLPWYSAQQGRNAAWLPIDSSYEDGDSALQFTSVTYPTQSSAYFDYRLSFPETRNPLSNTLRIGELEIPGMIVPPTPSMSPVAATDTPTDVFHNSIENVYPIIGKLGDHVEIDDSVPAPLNVQVVQDAFATLEYNPQEKAVLMCGSPDEVANDPFYGDHGFSAVVPLNSGISTRKYM